VPEELQAVKPADLKASSTPKAVAKLAAVSKTESGYEICLPDWRELCQSFGDRAFAASWVACVLTATADDFADEPLHAESLEQFVEAYSQLSAPAAVSLDLTLRRSKITLHVLSLATWGELVAW
jgi:hypothetical protein